MSRFAQFPTVRRLLACVVLLAATSGAIALATQASGPSGAVAEPGPGTPCPSNAPLKTFDVVSLNVDITMNRFGDHEPEGRMYALASEVGAVRRQERTRMVSNGLAGDAIQPLTLRVNVGDCVEVHFTNQLKGERSSMTFDGLPHAATGGGNAIGFNPDTTIAPGASTTYRTWVPDDTRACPASKLDQQRLCSANEGAHYFHSWGTDFRAQTNRGLFGAIVAEPKGSTVLDPRTGAPTDHGWDVMVQNPTGIDFRDFAIYYHEWGDEHHRVVDKKGRPLPIADPFTTAYRPGTRAMNYRSEPFLARFAAQRDLGLDGQAGDIFSSYTNGDPATPIERTYLGDPVKMRIIHGGGEVMHVHHLHGGGDRWAFEPNTNGSQFGRARDIARKGPFPREDQASLLIDAQTIGPGETYTTELECGAGGCQRAVGDYLFHCHVNEHYEAGMWSMVRVQNTKQADVMELPDRIGHMQPAVDSLGLVGTRPATLPRLTKDTVVDWAKGLLPPPGQRRDRNDASVFDWKVQQTPKGPVVLGEPNGKLSTANFTAHDPGVRPRMQFDPVTGHLAYPAYSTHIGARPPFAPGAHGPTVSLHDRAGFEQLCPNGAPVKHFDVRVTSMPIAVGAGLRDQNGVIYTLAGEEAAQRSGKQSIEPLMLRVNTGDCVKVTLADALPDAGGPNGLNWVNIHPHLGQFDIQATDGVVAGFNSMGTVRPFKVFGTTLARKAPKGARTVRLASVAGLHPGESVGIGLDSAHYDIRTVVSVSGKDVAIDKPLDVAHGAGEAASEEFVNYEMYFDRQMGLIYFHDHVDATDHLGHGQFGAYIVEPQGSKYRDPKTGVIAPADGTLTGTTADILEPKDTIEFGTQPAPFREQVVVFADNQPVLPGKTWTDYRLAPFDKRGGDPSQLFSSAAHGDPATPVLRAYAGDRTVFRVLSGAVNHIHQFSFPGQRFKVERWDSQSLKRESQTLGQSERFDFVGTAGGARKESGDWLWFDGINRHFASGNWGIFRVHGSLQPDLPPLPGNQPPAATPTATQSGAGNPCPTGAPARTVNVSIVRARTTVNVARHEVQGGLESFVMDSQLPASFNATGTSAAATTAPATGTSGGGGAGGGTGGGGAATAPGGATGGGGGSGGGGGGEVDVAEPLVLHAFRGECLTVHFTNRMPASADAASFVAPGLDSVFRLSGGITVGYDPQQAVKPGASRDYRYFVTDDLDATPIEEFAHPVDSWQNGAFGAINVEDPGSLVLNAVSGAPTDHGSDVVVVNNATRSAHRTFTAVLSEEDPKIGMDEMPYPRYVQGWAAINYKQEDLRRRSGGGGGGGGGGAGGSATASNVANGGSDTSSDALSSIVHGDPSTPVFRAFVGDTVKFNAVDVASEQIHQFTVEGHQWRFNPRVRESNLINNATVGPTGHTTAVLLGGAGGPRRIAGDYLYGDHKLPFLEAGMWGIMRVLPSDANAPQLVRLPAGYGPDPAWKVDDIAPAPDAAAPGVSGVRVTPSAPVTGGRLQVRFFSTEAGTARVVIGRRVEGRGHRIHRAHVASVELAVGNGPASLTIPGRLAKLHLQAGRYDVAVTVVDAAGNASTSVQTRFVVR